MTLALPIYLLCALTSATVALLLLQNYRRTKVPFLLWSSLCFGCLVINNVVLFFDMIVLPDSSDLSILRTVPVVIGMSVLLYGFIWDST